MEYVWRTFRAVEKLSFRAGFNTFFRLPVRTETLSNLSFLHKHDLLSSICKTPAAEFFLFIRFTTEPSEFLVGVEK
jgi:hypothetical protein